MLSVEHLSHRYGDLHVLRDASLFVRAGELVCLLGPSGCGKTTLLRIAAGIERCQAGEVRVDGKVVASGAANIHLPPEARQVGMMFQDFALFPHLTTRQNMMFGARSKATARGKWVESTAAMMGIGDLLDQYPATLSGGQQQRVALIRALAPNPNALLLDEPFSGLDTVRRAEVREQTRALIQETGIAALMVTHDPEEAMFMADRIAVMHEGRIMQIGAPDEVYFRPQTAFVASLFGPLNRVPSRHPLAASVRLARAERGLTQAGSGGVSTRNEGSDSDDQGSHDMLFRADNLLEVANDALDGSPATIIHARRLGSEVQLRLSLHDSDDAADHGRAPIFLQARWRAVQLPVEGDTIRIAIRYPDQVFVFDDPPLAS